MTIILLLEFFSITGYGRYPLDHPVWTMDFYKYFYYYDWVPFIFLTLLHFQRTIFLKLGTIMCMSYELIKLYNLYLFVIMIFNIIA